MLKPLVTIEDWSGGASMNPSLGRKNGYFTGNGIDHFTRPGYISTLPYKLNMLLDGGSAVDAPMYCGLSSADTLVRTYFGANAGKIYYQSAADSVTLDHTIGGAGNILDMAEYKGKMIYSYDTSLGYRTLGSSTYTDAWQTGLLSSTYKSICVSDDTLWVGHGYKIGKWDNSTWDDDAFTFPTNITIQKITEFGVNYLAIATNSATSSKEQTVYLWSRVDPFKYDDQIPIPENQIYSMIYASGGLWIMAGSKNLCLYYVALGTRTPVKIKEFKNEIDTLTPSCYPNTMSYKDGRVYFTIMYSGGLSSGYVLSGTLLTGVYSINTDLQKQDVACHYVNTTLSSNTTLGLIFFLGNLRQTNTTSYSIFWNINENTTATHGSLYREGNLSSDSPQISEDRVLYTFWYQAPVGSKFLFDGFGFDTYPRKTGRVTINYYTDFDLTTPTALFTTYSVANNTGSYVTKKVECTEILFTIAIDLESATSGVPKLFFKRFFATGGVVADSR